MSNIVWSAEQGWHDGPEARVTADAGRIQAKPIDDEVTEDDLDFARDTLGPAATEDEVRNLADLRADRDRGER